jgi:hypothetical protein
MHSNGVLGCLYPDPDFVDSVELNKYMRELCIFRGGVHCNTLAWRPHNPKKTLQRSS